LSTRMFAKAPVVVGQTFPARRFAHHWGGAVQTTWVTTTCNILSLLASITVMTPRLEDTFGKGHYRKLVRLGRECATRAGLPSEADFDGSSCDVADGQNPKACRCLRCSRGLTADMPALPSCSLPGRGFIETAPPAATRVTHR
jgi:hypothetical protein